MGQAGSAPQRARHVATLPHDPPRHAPKVLPSPPQIGCLRSTDNGVILQSGGTISGRRPTSSLLSSDSQQHTGVYRSRSAGGSGESGELRARERDPLHRSHTNLDLRHDGGSLNKRFGSEPDLRIEEEQKARNNNKHFRKKYRAPPPPHHDQFEGSSPDSSDGNARQEPQRKLRLFKTRNETKKLNGHESKLPYRSTYAEYKSLELNDNQFERRYRSPCKDKEQHYKYPDNKDMVQSTTSLKQEERLLQMRQDYKKTRTDKVSGCRAKTAKTNEHSEAWKTPLLNRNFRYSERFKKDEIELPTLRREKTFDETLLASEREAESPRAMHESRIKSIGDQLKGKLSPLAQTSMPLRKSLPSLLHKNNEEKDEFQAELKKATSRIRNEINSKVNINKKTSHNDVAARAPNPTKPQSKVTESSRTNKTNDTKLNSRRPSSRNNEVKPKTNTHNDVKPKATTVQPKFNSKENGRTMPDRGQASGKESTPEHSPTREKEAKTTASQLTSDSQKQPPSKQFYFGMIENKQSEAKDHLKDFPGLGSPIIEEFTDFHLIEQKLLGYHEEDDEIEKFKSKLKEDKKIVKNLSSESALSSEGSEGEGSDGSLGIAVRLRPTLPKKQMSMPRFSPAAAWRQLASLDAHFAAERQPLSLAVETKMCEVSAESSPRSDQSADKSGDSGISGDHAHSDHRLHSPTAHHAADATTAWTPQQDLGDSSSEGAAPLHSGSPTTAASPSSPAIATYSPGAQPFSLSLPRDSQDRGKQIQQGFNSLQKFRKSVSGALGAALGSRRFDLEHEPMLEEPEQNWFLTKSAPNSLSNPLLYQQPVRTTDCEDIKEEPAIPLDKEEPTSWRPGTSYLSWGGHVMYLPPAPATDQPLSMLGPIDRPIRSKSSGCLEAAARAARSAREGREARGARGAPLTSQEMRERERSASPQVARALPARVEPAVNRPSNAGGRSKRFTFQSTVRQLERRKLAEKLSKEADLKEQQRKTEQEAMRRVEEEFQRKRAREKANIRQQLRLVSSGAASMPTTTTHNNTKARDEPDGSCRESPAPERTRDSRQRHSNASSEISGRSKSTTPIRCVELSEWRCEGARVYRDWAAPPAHTHPPACARMPMSAHAICNAAETEAFSGSPRSDNYRLEFARGRSPRTPRAPRLLPAPRSPSTSGSELSLRHPIKISVPAHIDIESTKEESSEPAIVPTLRPARPALAIR